MYFPMKNQKWQLLTKENKKVQQTTQCNMSSVFSLFLVAVFISYLISSLCQSHAYTP